MEIQAGQTAQAEVSDFSQTVRTLFGDDALTLNALGLRPRQRTGSTTENGPETGQSRRNTPASGSMAHKIAQWRRLFAGAQALSNDQKAQLAQAGWNAERLTEAAALVERRYLPAGANTAVPQ